MIDATKIPHPVLHSLAYNLLKAVERSERREDAKQPEKGNEDEQRFNAALDELIREQHRNEKTA